MTRRNNDIAACGHATCPIRHTCLRWQLGQTMDDYHWFGEFKPTNGGCKFYMHNKPNNDNDNERED